MKLTMKFMTPATAASNFSPSVVQKNVWLHIDPITFAIQPPYFDLIILSTLHEAMFLYLVKVLLFSPVLTDIYFTIQLIERCMLM
jgi:hypothetical protein